jgi:hypothetical protein
VGRLRFHWSLIKRLNFYFRQTKDLWQEDCLPRKPWSSGLREEVEQHKASGVSSFEYKNQSGKKLTYHFVIEQRLDLSLESKFLFPDSYPVHSRKRTIQSRPAAGILFAPWLSFP